MNLREVTYLAWLKTLADTYDVYAKLAGVIQNDQPVLLPLAHSTFNAQIEVPLMRMEILFIPEKWKRVKIWLP